MNRNRLWACNAIVAVSRIDWLAGSNCNDCKRLVYRVNLLIAGFDIKEAGYSKQLADQIFMFLIKMFHIKY